MATSADVASTSGRLPSKSGGSQQTSCGPSSSTSHIPSEPGLVKTPTTTTTTTTSTSTTIAAAASKVDEGMEELEFTIAADLTLYANPLRCLRKTARPSLPHDSGSEMIAADLVKYGSPLDDKVNY